MSNMRYEFKIVETNVGTIEIGAESLEEAQDELSEAYFQGHVVWEDSALQFTLNKEWEDN